MNKIVLQILQHKDATIDWQNDYLNAIAQGTDAIDKMTSESMNKKVQRYFSEVLPKHWNVFKTITAYYKEKNFLVLPEYDVGIFLVGFSELPIIFSLATLLPKEIYFIYSPESKSSLWWIQKGAEAIQQELGNKVNTAIRDLAHGREVNAASDPIQTFLQIEYVLEQHPKKKIALDISGGKKTMISGAFLSASVSENCDVFYVDFLEYSRQNRRPVPGTEFLNKFNPTGFREAFIKLVQDLGDRKRVAAELPSRVGPLGSLG